MGDTGGASTAVAAQAGHLREAAGRLPQSGNAPAKLSVCLQAALGLWWALRAPPNVLTWHALFTFLRSKRAVLLPDTLSAVPVALGSACLAHATKPCLTNTLRLLACAWQPQNRAYTRMAAAMQLTTSSFAGQRRLRASAAQQSRPRAQRGPLRCAATLAAPPSGAVGSACSPPGGHACPAACRLPVGCWGSCCRHTCSPASAPPTHSPQDVPV